MELQNNQFYGPKILHQCDPDAGCFCVNGILAFVAVIVQNETTSVAATSSSTATPLAQEQKIEHPGEKIFKSQLQALPHGDPTAIQLFREYNGTQMTAFTSLSDEELRNQLEYLKFESESKVPCAPSFKSRSLKRGIQNTMRSGCFLNKDR